MRYRQEVEFRRQQLVAGIVAADNRNIYRQQSGDRIWEPLDYMAGEDEFDAKREAVKQNVASAYSMMLMMRPFKSGSVTEHQPLTVEEMADWRKKIAHDLRNQGFEDADALFDEALEKN